MFLGPQQWDFHLSWWVEPKSDRKNKTNPVELSWILVDYNFCDTYYGFLWIILDADLMIGKPFDPLRFILGFPVNPTSKVVNHLLPTFHADLN